MPHLDMKKTGGARPGRRRLAEARMKKRFGAGLVYVGKRKWTRDDLYER
jgi:hypothetical protein